MIARCGARGYAWTLWGLAALLLPATALAQPAQGAARGGGPSGAPRLTLDEAARITLVANAQLELSARQAELDHGQLLVAQEPFDLRLQTSARSGRERSLSPNPQQGSQLTRVTTEQVTYRLGIQKQLRWGVALMPEVVVTRTSLSSAPGAATGRASGSLSVGVPLWRDRWGAGSGTVVRAAERRHESSMLAVRHTAAQSVFSTVTAYWDYVAAHRRLEVYRASEARAERMVNETRVLVDAEERTATELKQVQSNLATRRVARIGAEQALVDARTQLGLAMGVAPEAMAALPAPATEFPRPTAEAAADSTPARLLRIATARRADLAASEEALRSAELLVAAARNDLRPRLDLSIGTGYTGLAHGAGMDRLFAPLYENVPGLNSVVQLSYELPITNNGARGRLLQQDAAREQQRISRSELARQIGARVYAALELLRSSRSGLASASEASSLSMTSVQSEQRKFRLGVSALFDVLQAEEGLVSALLTEIGGQRSHAVAVATLRFETGTLLGFEGERPVVTLERLTTPP